MYPQVKQKEMFVSVAWYGQSENTKRSVPQYWVYFVSFHVCLPIIYLFLGYLACLSLFKDDTSDFPRYLVFRWLCLFVFSLPKFMSTFFPSLCFLDFFLNLRLVTVLETAQRLFPKRNTCIFSTVSVISLS